MTRIKTYLNSLGRATRTSLLALAVVFVSAGIAQAASTISTNISTGGTLAVTGLSTLTAGFVSVASSTAVAAFNVTGLSTLTGGFVSQASSTVVGTFSASSLQLLSGDTIKNASASSTALSGNLTVGGGTGSATLTVTNTANATSTATAGCVVTTATSSATSIRLLFNTQATTTSINGNTVQGVVLWGYGSSCAN